MVVQKRALKVPKDTQRSLEEISDQFSPYVTELHTTIKDAIFKDTSGDVYGRSRIISGFFNVL